MRESFNIAAVKILEEVVAVSILCVRLGLSLSSLFGDSVAAFTLNFLQIGGTTLKISEFLFSELLLDDLLNELNSVAGILIVCLSDLLSSFLYLLNISIVSLFIILILPLLLLEVEALEKLAS
jgi:hypothetical protein